MIHSNKYKDLKKNKNKNGELIFIANLISDVKH